MPRSCWVPEALVGPDRDPESVLAMADRLLAEPDGLPPGDWVAVHNYFRHRLYREEVDASPLLSLRRLEVLMRALDAAQAERGLDPDPRTVAWLESLDAEVDVLPDRAGPQWVIGRAVVNTLYEAHQEDPLAEEILWRTARHTLERGECELSIPCVFEGILPHAARYWRSFPRGRFVDDAISAAVASLGRAQYGSGLLGACEWLRSNRTYDSAWESWDELAWPAQGRPAVLRLLATLSEVSEETRAPLVDYLDRVERCAQQVATLSRPLEEPQPTRGGESEPTPETRELAIISPGVSCRRRPSRRSRGEVVLRVDEHFTTAGPDTVVAGDAWVSVRGWGPCWVPRAVTAPADTDDHVLAIADRFLDSAEGRTLDHSLRVYNVLGSRSGGHRVIGSRVGGHREVVDRSGLLSLRRLQVLEEVLLTLRRFEPWEMDALTRGWLSQLVDDVEYWSIGEMWAVRDEAFERVYEEHRDSPEAEDVLWELATGPALHDCESSFACWAKAEVLDRVGRYWTDYPRGRHVAEAVRRAAARLEQVGWSGRTCGDNWAPIDRQALSDLRATLVDVAPSDAEPLTTLLDRLEACAAEVG
ncbi:hypothetical protein [Candidatus Palauibacter sp.]|uniref:hypothetical protein n=1 Tax=Candidatus Palauibacter sp. TaxID=3101350 RepID=UPI003B025AA6